MGFAHIGLILLALLVITAIGGVGWRVLGKNKKSINSFAECVAAGNKVEVEDGNNRNCKANGNTYTEFDKSSLPEGVNKVESKDQNKSEDEKTAQEEIDNAQKERERKLKEKADKPVVGYLKINEFGVKLPLIEDISDAYYVIKTDEDGAYASISTHKLVDYYGSECDPTKYNYVAMVGYFTDPNADDALTGTSTNKEVFPDAIQIGSRYYYYAVSHQYGCYYVTEKSKDLGINTYTSFDAMKLEKL